MPKKLARYAAAVTSLRDARVWWQTLSPVERAASANVTQLVQTVEEIIAADSKGWLASNTVAKALSKAAGDEAAQTGDPGPAAHKAAG